jgi:hypothetical protein
VTNSQRTSRSEQNLEEYLYYFVSFSDQNDRYSIGSYKDLKEVSFVFRNMAAFFDNITICSSNRTNSNQIMHLKFGDTITKLGMKIESPPAVV